MAPFSTNSLIMESLKSHLDSSTLQGATPLPGPPRPWGTQRPCRALYEGKQTHNRKQNPGVSKNCCSCLCFLKVCVPFSLPPSTLIFEGQVPISGHETGFLAAVTVWFHPPRQWAFFPPRVKGSSVWSLEFQSELVPKLQPSCSVLPRSSGNLQACGVQ